MTSGMAAAAVVHWDFENQPVPAGTSTASVVGRFRKVLMTKVRVISDMFVYGNASKVPATTRSQLASLGFDFIDCNHPNKKGQVDLRIIARALKPGLTSEPRPAVVMVTGDVDYTYCISTLRNAGVGTILIYNADRMEAVADHTLLIEACETVLPVSFSGKADAEEDVDEADSPRGREERSSFDAGSDVSGGQRGGGSGPTSTSDSAASSSSSGAKNEALRRAFLHALDAAPATSDGWRLHPQVAELFHKIKPIGDRTTYRQIRLALTEEGCIESCAKIGPGRVKRVACAAGVTKN